MMTASVMDSSIHEIINSLDLTKVPDKLHCAACHKFLINAYKPTCCDQSICEPCFNESSGSCPVCDHKPFSDDLCKPSKAMRGTAKAYLKTVEKSKAEERPRPSLDGTDPSEEQVLELQTNGTKQHETMEQEVVIKQPSQELVDSIEVNADEARPESAIDEDNHLNRTSESPEPGDDEVEIQVEPSQEGEDYDPGQNGGLVEEEDANQSDFFMGNRKDSTGVTSTNTGANDMSGDFPNMMNMNFNNMDYTQMMQQMMAANGMNGFNPMMGMPMGMNPMAGMFGGFGGPTGNMNGMNNMNMGMNFNSNQGMFGGWNSQNNNMWQNNNANAFSNTMGNDFNSSYGFNQNNMHQHQYPNGDFQNGYYGRGYGRGRGRGRGGYGRFRGNFNQFSQFQQGGFQNGYDQQYNNSNVNGSSSNHLEEQGHHKTGAEDVEIEHDNEFAPGGQEEVQEALGDEFDKSKTSDNVLDNSLVNSEAGPTDPVISDSKVDIVDTPSGNNEDSTNVIPGTDIMADERPAPSEISDNKPIPAAYEEDLEMTSAPPTAPSGPSGRYNQDFGFRSRGHGRFASRGRGSLHLQNGHPVSPVKQISTGQPTSPVEPKGVGVVGAPTGPRAMREPLPKPVPRSNTGGFQIMGRATKVVQDSSPSIAQKPRSPSPRREDQEEQPETMTSSQDQSSSRRRSELDRRDNNSYEDEEYERKERDSDRAYEHSRRRERSRRDDYENGDQDESYTKSNSAERRSSYRNRHEKEHYSSNTNYRTSDSRRYRADDLNRDYEMEDYEESANEPTRENHDSGSKSTRRKEHRSRRSSKYDERDRDERRRDRKRSRHDRDRDEEYPDDYEEEQDEGSRHRARRHKKDHHRSDEIYTNGRSHRSSEAATPTTSDKDPHTLEREARNRERMLKEQQRREKAANASDRKSGPSSSGRRISYKYEDEAERGMVENERAAARWR